ncbi:uncharacterized protein [Rhodnius prolixus]|uniref:uncharacterized protein n=1 Tax=Rhodnius prolixus TaxID=13249 RepID=UPI003D18AEF5
MELVDPVEIIPIEVLDYIWSLLPLPDLLSCLAVCHLWRDTLTECSEVWRPFCRASKLQPLSTWYTTFLEEAKMRWPWKVGSFTKGVVIEDCQYFCCTEDSIYIVDLDSKLCKYNQSAELLKEISVPEECKQICPVNKDIALLCAHEEWNEVIIFSEELHEVARFTTNDDLVWTSGGRLWFRSAGDHRIMMVYYAEDREESRHMEELLVAPGTILMPLSSGWCSVYKGEVLQLNGEQEDRLYKCDQTPMSRIFLTMFTDNKEIVAVIDKKIIAGKHTFCTVLIFRNGIRLHRADIPKQLRYWCFSGPYLVLASYRGISTIELFTGVLHIGEESKGLNFSDFIYGVQDIFNHPRIAWVIINYGTNFVVHDAEKNTNLIVVNCERSINMISASLNTLICVKSMFAYTLKGNRLMVRKTVLE